MSATTTMTLAKLDSPLCLLAHGAPKLLRLPVELLEIISTELERPDLNLLARTNKLLNVISTRTLYRELTGLSQEQSIRALRSFVYPSDVEEARKRALHVRTLHLDFSNCRVTANFLRLLQRALQTLHSLKDLSLEFGLQDNHYSIAWCLKDCPFQLRIFTTSIRCDEDLAAFIEGQRKLEELVLRGFQTTSPFTLSPDALPKLSAFRTVHAGVPVLKEVMKGRPIEATQIKRLTIMSLGDTPPDMLLPEIAARLPALEALHIVVLMARYSYENLLASTPYLTAFSSLRYLTFMTGGGTEVIEDERRVVYTWAKACSTLRTIILPRGKVWFERDGRWTCCASD
ncbi:unnamed protein product [Somion occarium]|uniref:F-box domain-containing protein n=1 Tax=Somion occarium TaxID=3059160 RepID=A0ABP1D476_9APHY